MSRTATGGRTARSSTVHAPGSAELTTEAISVLPQRRHTSDPDIVERLPLLSGKL